ncbi:MAG: hypothetical protein ABFD25_14275 [Clostridiaceae bacterium]
MEENKYGNQVHIRIGKDGIEFDAKGDSRFIEREREAFETKLLPLGVDAIARTCSTTLTQKIIESDKPTPSLLVDRSEASSDDTFTAMKDTGVERESIATFIKKHGSLTERDFVLFAAYFDEIKNGTKFFTISDVIKYYTAARRPTPSNNSSTLNQLAEKGLIIDAPNSEKKIPKPYIVSDEGIKYIQLYKPKQDHEKKGNKTNKPHPKVKSVYSDIDTQELHLDNYPAIKSLKDFKDKMMMVMYIITKEKKGEWFTIADVFVLLTDIFGENATVNQIKGVFKREKLWFRVENVEGNDKSVKRRIQNKGMEFAESLITK